MQRRALHERPLVVRPAAVPGFQLREQEGSPIPVERIDQNGMPDMGGIEATQRLKALRPDLPIVMVTSDESDCSILKAFEAGADAYALKPCTIETL